MAERFPLRQVEPSAGAVDRGVPEYDLATDTLVVGPPRTRLDDVIVTVTNGVPMLMFDADSTPVTTEVPS